jgi:DNA topoisomerase-3
MPEFAFTVGQVVGAVACRYEKKQTQRPERFTDSTLVDAMLHADRYASTEADRTILRQREGLGTSRTRSPTIETLVAKGYLRLEKRGRRNELISETRARVVCEHLPDFLVDVATTAKWEIAFDLIEQGKASPQQLRAKVEDLVLEAIEAAKTSSKSLCQLSAGAAKPANGGVAGGGAKRKVS